MLPPDEASIHLRPDQVSRATDYYHNTANQETDFRKPGLSEPVGEEFLAVVPPVLGAEVDEFEQPPAPGGEEEEPEVGAPTAGGERGAFAGVYQPINQQAVADPQAGEAPMGAQAFEAPVERPEEGDEGQAEPAATGEGVGEDAVFHG